MFGNSSLGARAAGAIMFLIGVLFGVAAAINMIILLKVSYLHLYIISLDDSLLCTMECQLANLDYGLTAIDSRYPKGTVDNFTFCICHLLSPNVGLSHK